MVGRLDDWLKVVMERDNITTDPGYMEWAGWRCSRRHIEIFRERGYRLRLLSAAFRNHMHWSEFIGGDVVISPPYFWQQRFAASDVAVVPRIDAPVSPDVVDALLDKFVDFRRAYTEDGLAPTSSTGSGQHTRPFGSSSRRAPSWTGSSATACFQIRI